MGAIKPAPAVKLICGVLASDADRLARAIDELSQHVGPIDTLSPVWPFEWTEYYAEEMGSNLLRQFAAFGGVFDPCRLAETKLLTNRIEARLCEAHGLAADRRPINLDPGYIALGKLVLATTKDQAHRVYLSDGIYGEVTLKYSQHRWHVWPWTYRDYASGTYDDFFIAVRSQLKAELMEQDRT